jgi:hypothetical protein
MISSAETIFERRAGPHDLGLRLALGHCLSENRLDGLRGCRNDITVYFPFLVHIEQVEQGFLLTPCLHGHIHNQPAFGIGLIEGSV